MPFLPGGTSIGTREVAAPVKLEMSIFKLVQEFPVEEPPEEERSML
jgi:hypothetical protein